MKSTKNEIRENSALIDCQTFVKLMQEYVDYAEKEKTATDAVSAIDSYNQLYFGYWHDLFVRTISYCFSNREIAWDWLSYWCWGCDLGKDVTPNSVLKDGKSVPFKTLEDVYRCIVGEK